MEINENSNEFITKLKSFMVDDSNSFHESIVNNISFVIRERCFNDLISKKETIYGRFPVKLQIEFEEFNDKLMDFIYENWTKEPQQLIEKLCDLKVGFGENDSFPVVKLDDMNESNNGLALKGFTVVDFWATWCEFCQAPMQKFVDYSSKMKNVKFIAISCDEKKENWLSHINNKKWKGSVEHYNNKKNKRGTGN